MARESWIEALLHSPPWYPLQRVLDKPLNVAQWDWSQLNPQNARSFRWDYGTTPLTNWQFIVGVWAVYFSSILLIRVLMRNRPAFELKQTVAVHNVILTVWSLVMFVFIVIDSLELAADRGVEALFCADDRSVQRSRLFYGIYIYYLSKFYELLDTIILVLKKKPVIFLHWYHHAIVILMVWSWLHYGMTFAALGMTANTLIHVFMYYYYYRTALGHKVWYKRYITSGQIVQFSISFLLTVPFLYYYFAKPDCAGIEAFVFSMFCNGTFLLLFVRFYRNNYGGGGGEDAGGKRGSTKKTN